LLLLALLLLAGVPLLLFWPLAAVVVVEDVPGCGPVTVLDRNWYGDPGWPIVLVSMTFGLAVPPVRVPPPLPIPLVGVAAIVLPVVVVVVGVVPVAGKVPLKEPPAPPPTFPPAGMVVVVVPPGGLGLVVVMPP
jgi:hypothetical protein